MNDYLKHRQNQKIYGKSIEPKKNYVIPKKSAKKIAEEKQLKELGSDSEMDLFFESMRKKMKGHCLFCGGKSEKENDETYRRSIAHLMPKAIFKSISANENNWVELCFYGNSCHTNFDNGKITWEFLFDSKEGEILKEKLLLVLPAVAPLERKNKLYNRLIELVYGKDNNNKH